MHTFDTLVLEKPMNLPYFVSLLEKFCNLDACSKNMSVKKLIREGITYNTLRKFFEECRSFMDFYKIMKTYGIERKVAKFIALHFSGQGLENQGALAYATTNEKSDPAAVTSENLTNGKEPASSSLRPVRSSPQDSRSTDHALDGEDWEREAEAGLPRKDFTLRCSTATPLSHTAEDIFSDPPGKTRSDDRTCGSSKVPLSLSANSGWKKAVELANSQQNEVCGQGRWYNAKQSPKKAKRHARGATSKSSARSSPEKKQTQGHFPEEGSKESVVVTKSKKTKVVQRVPFRSNDDAKQPDKGKERTIAARKIQPASFAHHLSPVSCFGEPCKTTETSTLCSGNGDSGQQTEELIKKFTSVFIGDITILVPIENGDPQSNLQMKDTAQDFTALNDNQPDKQTAADSQAPVDTFMEHQESSAPCHVALSTDMVSRVQLDKDLSRQEWSQNEGNHERELSGQASESNLGDSRPLSYSSIGNVEGCLPDADNMTVFGNDRVKELVHSTDAILPIDSSAVINEVTLQQPTHGYHENSNEGQASLLVFHRPEDPSIGLAENQWQDLQQVSSEAEGSPFYSTAADYQSSEVVCLDHVLDGHGIHPAQLDRASFVGQTHSDNELLLTEVSSESSSTSDEHPLDIFFRQPPLGAERGFTPDTVQQQQPGWVESSSGVYQMPSRQQSIGYGQCSWPPFGHLYGALNQSPQAVPFIRPYYSSYGYPPVHPPQTMVQPAQPAYLPPFQYRNQAMFSNPAQANLALIAPQEYIPSLLQLYPGVACYPYPSVSFYDHAYDQTIDTSGTAPQDSTVVVEDPSRHQNTCQVHSNVGFPSSSAAACRNSSADASSSTSSDNSLDFPTSVETRRGNSWSRMSNHYFLGQEPGSVQTGLVSTCLATTFLSSNEGNSNDASLNSNDQSMNSNDRSINWNDKPINSNDRSVMMMTEKMTTSISSFSRDGESVQTSNEVSTIPSMQQTLQIISCESIGSADKPQREGTSEEATQQEMGVMSIGRRLSPDGSSVVSTCADSSADDKIEENLKRPEQADTISARSSVDLSVEHRRTCNKPSADSIRGGMSSPKPQRMRQNRNRRISSKAASSLRSEDVMSKHQHLDKGTTVLRGDHSTNRDLLQRTRSLDCNVLNDSGEQNQRSVNQKKVRFSKEKVECNTMESPKNLGQPQHFRSNESKDVTYKGPSQSTNCVKRGKGKPLGYEGKGIQNESVRVESSKRSFSVHKGRPFKEKQRQKRPPPVDMESNQDPRVKNNNHSS